MKKHDKFASRPVAAMETMELRQLLSSVTGTVFDDWDLNGRLSVGEPGKAGRTVYADYNYNRTLDAAEPRAITDENGRYSLETRAQNVELRVVVFSSEELTLGYGATSIWLSAVSGTVTDKNFGIWYPTNTPSVSGTVFADANRNGHRDAGEAGLAGRTVFADYNYNGRFDAGDIPTTTNASGDYQLFSVRTGGIQIGVVVEADESVSLPSGTTTLWIGDLPGLGVSGKNLGIATIASVSQVTGTFYFDTNGNLRYDAGDMGLPDRTVFADYNYNRVLDAGEPFAVTDAYGHYTLQTRSQHVELHAIVRDNEQLTGPNLYWLPTVNGIVTDKNFRVATIVPQYVEIPVMPFVDSNSNGIRDPGERLRQITGLWIDANRNWIKDANELSYDTTAPIPADAYKLSVLPGTYQVVVSYRVFGITRSIGTEMTVTPGHEHVFSFALLDETTSEEFAFVHLDLNGDGQRQIDEPGLSGQTVFADYNGNGRLDSGEPSGVTNADGYAYYRVTQPVYDLYLIPTADYIASSPAGAGPIHFDLSSGSSWGPHFSLIRRPSGTVNGTVYADTNRNGRRDAGEIGLANRTVFADYNYNGVLDAIEPRAITDASGNYSLGTRSTQVSVRMVLNAGEQLTLGYGATSIWLSSVNGTVTGKNFGIFTGASLSRPALTEKKDERALIADILQ